MHVDAAPMYLLNSCFWPRQQPCQAETLVRIFVGDFLLSHFSFFFFFFQLAFAPFVPLSPVELVEILTTIDRIFSLHNVQ